jgi:hypothetical protein
MTIRQGMTDLVQLLRQWGQAGTAEYTIGSETYYTDDHLEDILDRNRSDIYREPLTMQISYSGGTAVYQDYYFERGHVEQATSGATAWQVEDGAGSAIGTGEYTPSYSSKHLRFAADTGGSALYLTYRSYNVEMCAAEVWDGKAASISESAWDVSTDNHSIKRSQKVANYYKNAAMWRARALSSVGGNTGESYLVRSDVNV